MEKQTGVLSHASSHISLTTALSQAIRMIIYPRKYERLEKRRIDPDRLIHENTTLNFQMLILNLK